MPKPTLRYDPGIQDELEHIFTHKIASASGEPLEDLPLPKWAFLDWLAAHKAVLLHGSGNPNIHTFRPRAPKDRSPDDFSKQTAVFASDDPIWPIFYAVLDRTNSSLVMLNGALRFRLPDGTFSQTHYFFSLTETMQRRHPWREGVVYILPKRSFSQQQPYQLGGFEVFEPHWASPSPVHLLAKLRVTSEDFPFLDQVRAHDDEVVSRRALQNPHGFPWLDPPSPS